MSRVAVLLGLLIALTILGSSAVAVALPQLGDDFGLDTSGTAWVLAVYSLSFSVAAAFFGRLADLRGLRFPLRLGGLIYAIGSLLAASAWSFPVLLTGRLVQGVGAGAVPVIAMAIVAARFPGAAARAKAFGGLAAVVSIVSGSGPLIGGAIAEVLTWRGVLGLPAVALLLAEPVARLAPARASAPGGQLDVSGAVLVAATVSFLSLLLQSPATGLGPGPAVGFAVLTALSGAWLARHIIRRPGGFIPLEVMRTPAVVATALTGASLLAAYIGMLLAVPLLLSAEQGWRPIQIGLALLPAAAAGALASRLVGVALSRGGSSRLSTALAALAPIGLLLAWATHARPSLLVAAMALVVIPFAGGQVVLLERVTTAVGEQTRGVALGVFHVMFFTGSAVGAAAVGGLSGVMGLPRALAAVAILPAAGCVLDGWQMGKARRETGAT